MPNAPGTTGKQVWVWTHSDEERRLLRLGAAAEGIPVSGFLLKYGLAAAKKNLDKIKKE